MTYLSDILFDISVDRDTHMSPATVYHFPFSTRAAPALNRLAAVPPCFLSVRFYYSRTEVSPTLSYLCSHLSLPYSRLCISSYRSGNQYSVRFYYSRTETLYLVLQTRSPLRSFSIPAQQCSDRDQLKTLDGRAEWCDIKMYFSTGLATPEKVNNTITTRKPIMRTEQSAVTCATDHC